MRATMSPSPHKRMATPCSTTMATMRFTKRASKRTRCLRPSNMLRPMSAPALSFESWYFTVLPSRIKLAMPVTKPDGSTTSSALPPTRSLSWMSMPATSSSGRVRKALTIMDKSSPGWPVKSMTRPQSKTTIWTPPPFPRLQKRLPGCMSPWTKRCWNTIAQKRSTRIFQAAICSFASSVGPAVSSSWMGSPSSKLMTSASDATQRSKTSGMMTGPSTAELGPRSWRKVRRFFASSRRSVWASRKSANCRSIREQPRWSRPRHSENHAAKRSTLRSMSTALRTCGCTTFTATLMQRWSLLDATSA
mmetsp:Transcript_141234/g.451422  ORF Transcript_141234/g.451422 Transcript_141234/m.451422 type:complete len:305 (-) Transcript_141234:831-1745(-)